MNVQSWTRTQKSIGAHCGGGEWKNGWQLSVAFTVTHIWGDGLHTLKQFIGFQQCKGICFGSPACELMAALIPVTTSGSRYYPLPFEEWNGLQEDFWDFAFLSLWWGPGVIIPQDPGIFVTQASGLLHVESPNVARKGAVGNRHVVAGLLRQHLYFKETSQLLWTDFRI